MINQYELCQTVQEWLSDTNKTGQAVAIPSEIYSTGGGCYNLAVTGSRAQIVFADGWALFVDRLGESATNTATDENLIADYSNTAVSLETLAEWVAQVIAANLATVLG